jgi:hypothetical protein
MAVHNVMLRSTAMRRKKLGWNIWNWTRVRIEQTYINIVLCGDSVHISQLITSGFYLVVPFWLTSFVNTKKSDVLEL